MAAWIVIAAAVVFHVTMTWRQRPNPAVQRGPLVAAGAAAALTSSVTLAAASSWQAPIAATIAAGIVTYHAVAVVAERSSVRRRQAGI